MRPVLMALMALVLGSAATAAEKTLVFRVVTTDPKWGQEAIPGWPVVSAVKDAPGYALFDVEIGRDASRHPIYVALRKFENEYATASFLHDGEEMVARALLEKRNIEDRTPDGSSRGVREALEHLLTQVIEQQHPTRIVINYAGHGSVRGLFEDAINGDDSEKLLDTLRRTNKSGNLLLDLSTNCQQGYLEYIGIYAKHVDYILASEKNYGGFAIPQADREWTKDAHDIVYDQFWKPEYSTQRAFDEMVAARRRLWLREAEGIRAAGHDKEQSIVVYDTKRLPALMAALRGLSDAQIKSIPLHSRDIGAFIYDSRDQALIHLFENFRSRYASTRDVVAWDDDARGLSIRSTEPIVSTPSGQ